MLLHKRDDQAGPDGNTCIGDMQVIFRCLLTLLQFGFGTVCGIENLFRITKKNFTLFVEDNPVVCAVEKPRIQFLL